MGVGLSHSFVAWVGSCQPSLGLENFPFKFFPFWSKISSGGVKNTRDKGGLLSSYLLQVKSMLGSDQGPSLVLMLGIFLNPLVSAWRYILYLLSGVPFVLWE